MNHIEIEHHIDEIRKLDNEIVVMGPEEDLSQYETGARYLKGKAAFIIRPSNTKQVSQIISYCVKHQVSVIPQSGNTGVVAGSTPDTV